jgi:hypothetical protein
MALLSALAMATLARGLPAAEPEKGDARGIAVVYTNDNPVWKVRVHVDHADNVYRVDDEMKVFVKSEKEGYLYLFYCDAGGHVSVLFPNKVQTDNKIPAGKEIRVPAEEATFRLRITEPEGKEVLKALVTLEPLKSLKVDNLTRDNFTVLSLDSFKGAIAEPVGGEAPPGTRQRDEERREKPREYVQKMKKWAEHDVQITVIGKGKPDPYRGKKPRKVGVFVGISQFQSPAIRKLRCSHLDAERMAEVMKDQCGLSDPIVLTNEKATLKNIEKAIRQDLPAKTRPGDVVVIYWSGHGGRCAATTRDEPDGYDEFLVPYDGKLDDIDTIRTTMLMDDTFGRWVQALDGRKVVVILDACHSGGQAASPFKALEEFGKGLTGGPDVKPKGDFFAREFDAIKDIDQKETAVLASSRAAQISFERREGDLSVMTFYLIEQLKGSGKVSLAQAYENLKGKVPEYVMKKFPGATQTPVLVDRTTPTLYVKE